MGRGAIRTELLKYTTGRSLAVLVGSGIGLCTLGTYGFLLEARETPGAVEQGLVTDGVIRAWMMMMLFTALAGALAVTRDYAGATMGRSVLTAGGRSAVLAAKAVATLTVSGLVALGTMALAAGSAVLAVRDAPQGLVWTAESTRTLLGVGAVVLLAGLWGLAIGWVVKNQVGALATVLVLTLVLEPGLQRLVPDVARYLFTIAMSSVYRDGKPELLSVPWALAVGLAWIAVLGALGARSFTRRDLR